MNFNTFVSSIEDLDRCAAVTSVTEVLIEPTLLAMQGHLSEREAAHLAHSAHERGLRPVLVWDIQLPERTMQLILPRLETWDWSAYAAVRVADVGAAWWLHTHQPHVSMQLLVETGSHNMHALEGWCQLFEHTLERLILSIELPEERLLEYSQTLPVACEVMGVGRILLFNSPRSLLAHHIQGEKGIEQHIAATIASEKSNNRPFPLLETPHGTLMFLDKDQFILDRLLDLERAGFGWVRLDLRHLSSAPHACESLEDVCTQMKQEPIQLRKEWPRKTRAPFFKTNRTTAQFVKMKSKTHAKRDHSCIAEVIAIHNGDCIIGRSIRPFRTDRPISIQLPTGEERPLDSTCTFQLVDAQKPTWIDADQVFLMDWQKKTCTGALLHQARIHQEADK